MTTICILTNKHTVLHLQIAEHIAYLARKDFKWIVDIENFFSFRYTALSRRIFNGLIATTLSVPAIVRIAKHRLLPFVGFSPTTAHAVSVEPYPVVHFDQTAIARLAAEHFLQHGYRHFAYYGIQPGANMQWDQERLTAFDAILRTAGFRVFVCAPPYCRRSIEIKHAQILVPWLQRLPRPVGIFCANDGRAQHVLEGCRLAGLRVPDDIGVIGVDNDETICRSTNPPLTSIQHNFEQIAEKIIKLMALQLKGQCVKSRIIAVRPAGIATRGSTNTLCGDRRLVKASRFIETNIHQPIGTPDVARHIGVSRSTLDRLAVKQLGRSIPGIITDRRLEHAKHLLNNTSLTLDAIVKQTGFTSPQYFCAVFKRSFGYTPLAYRKKNAARS